MKQTVVVLTFDCDFIVVFCSDFTSAYHRVLFQKIDYQQVSNKTHIKLYNIHLDTAK